MSESFYRFSRNRRIRKPSEFTKVYRNNQARVVGQYFLVLAFFRHNELAENSINDTMLQNKGRIGVVVSKKVSKIAVQRNRIKRQVREQARKTKQLDGFDFVIIAKPNAANADNNQLFTELNYLWGKLHKKCVTF